MSNAGLTSGAASNTQYFSLRWNNHQVNLVSVITGLFNSKTLVDVTLAAEGKHIQAHKMLLSACSDYFQSLFSANPCQHPIVILKDVSFEDLHTVVQFMYNGVVNVSSEKLPAVLKTADTLQIKGLGEKLAESMHQLMGNNNWRTGSTNSDRLLSVPSQHSVNSRQWSTESLPAEYLHSTRDYSSPRQASTDSRQYSVESLGGGSTTIRRQAVSPPSSPPPRHLRKKFRRGSACGSSSERGNSLEDDRSPGATSRSNVASSPTIHLSPSRQSSSSTEIETPPTTGMTVAKKKRELFSARNSRSGGSNKSSASDYSREHSDKRMESSSGSSGLSQSQSMSQDEAANTNTLTVPNNTTTSRTLARAQSAGEARSDELPAKFNKRGKILRRQDCLEKGDNIGVPPDTVRSSPNSPLMGPYPSLGSPDQYSSPAPLVKQRSHPSPPPPEAHQQLGIPKVSSPAPHSPYPPSRLLPSVRVIPDAAVDPLAIEGNRVPSLPTDAGLLHPGFEERRKRPPLPDPPYLDTRHGYLGPHHPPPPLRDNHGYIGRGPTVDPSYMLGGMGRDIPHMTTGPPLPPPPSTSPIMSSPGMMSHPVSHPVPYPPPPSAPQTTDQFGHCPKARDGPALGCNYCWNTTDGNGRILRRKTKYHCPECQANLCIVPCFQAYHEAIDKEKNMASH